MSGIPRFLFRGYNSKSGGGKDPRLNGPDGVVPHAFLDGETPTSMWDMEDIYDNLTDHIGYVRCKATNSHFSSWTHYMATSLHFAGDSLYSMIAVLDTASMGDRIWFTEDLFAAGLTWVAYPNEYVIYGPVSGPGYYCIPAWDLELVFTETRFDNVLKGEVLRFPGDRIGVIEQGAVEGSREIAVALQPQGASTDKILILMAKFVGMRAENFLGPLELLSYPDINGFLYYVRDDLQGLAMRTDARFISLADQTMSTEHSQGLVFEVQMLMAAENAVHVLGWDVRAAVSTLLVTSQDEMDDVVDE